MPLVRPTTTWRDWYNPLKGLSVARIVAMEDAADRGQHADLQWFWRHMELVDVTIQAAMARRLAFIDTVDWQVRAVDGADPVLAQEQAALLTYAYNRIANLKEATRFLGTALFRGFAHVEKLRSGYGELIAKLDPIDPWYWTREGREGHWRFNPESKSHNTKGEIVDTTRLVVVESTPIHRAIGRHFFAKMLAFADWDQALELGANQSIFFVGPPGVSPEKELEYRNIAEQMASNGRGYLPNGADVKVVDTAARSRLPYFDRVRYCDEQIVMAATGGLLTMLTQSGSGTLAGGAHSDTLLSLAQSDAAMLSEAFQRQVDRELLSAFFPRQPHVAYFAFEVPQRTDNASLLESVANLSWAGYGVEKAWLEEKTGMKLIERPLPA